MKLIFTILALAFLTASSFAQSPEKMSYQYIIRDYDSNLVREQTVGMLITILQGTANGSSVYVESHNPQTNTNGLVSVEIGTGSTNDDFSSIDWARGPYFIKTETDISAGTNYSIANTSQLLSFPYALHTKTARSVTGIEAGGLPVYTSDAINTLNPEPGDVVFNSSLDHFQIFNGNVWQSFNADCWPQPTQADAGPDQFFGNGMTSTTLSANTPAEHHGAGEWSILSGLEGSFADAGDPHTTFTGKLFETYTLQWAIESSCGTSSDEVIVTFDIHESLYHLVGQNLEGKTWVFDGGPTPDGRLWYFMSLPNDPDSYMSPWWNAGGECCPPADADGKMHFDLDGAANYSYYSGPNADPETGSFILNTDDQLLTVSGPNIPGYLSHEDIVAGNEEGTYQIMELSADKLVLYAPLNDYSTGWTWVFKPQTNN